MDDKNLLYCCRCRCPFKIQQSPHKDFLEGRDLQKYPLCKKCEIRDKNLLVAALHCVRLYGGKVTFHEVLDLYSNTEIIKRLQIDPFSKVRPIYNGFEKLSITDLERWVDCGFVKKAADNTLSIKELEVREEIELQLEIIRELENKSQVSTSEKIIIINEDQTQKTINQSHSLSVSNLLKESKSKSNL